jgi:hypothetical protein
MEVGLDYYHIWKWVIAQAQNKSENFFSQSVYPLTKAIFFSPNRVFYCFAPPAKDL